MKFVCIFVVATLISGCVSPYIPPTSGPTAKIRFVNDAQRNLHVAYFDQSNNCKDRRWAEAILPTTENEHTIFSDWSI